MSTEPSSQPSDGEPASRPSEHLHSGSDSPPIVHDVQSQASTPASSIAPSQLLTPLDGQPTSQLRSITTKQSADIGLALSANLAHLQLHDDADDHHHHHHHQVDHHSYGLGVSLEHDQLPSLQQPGLDALASFPTTLSSSHSNQSNFDDNLSELLAFQSSSLPAPIPPEQAALAKLPPDQRQVFEAILAAKNDEIKRERNAREAKEREIEARDRELERERAESAAKDQKLKLEMEARKQAEAHQERKTSFLENVAVFDHAMLHDMRKRHKTDPPLRIGNLQRNRGLPHTISPDKLMMEECPKVIRWISDMMGNHHCVPLSRSTLTWMAKDASHENGKIEKAIEALSSKHTMGGILPSMLLALAHKIVELEQARQTSSQDTDQHWQKLKESFPGIPWKLILDGRVRVLPEPLDPLNVQRRESMAARSQDAVQGNSADDDDDDDAAGKGQTSDKKSYDPKTSRLMTDFFFSFQDSNDEWVTFHLCEIKAYHVGNSWKLQEFFTDHQHNSTPSPSEGHRWRTINVPELASDKALDRQALSGVSQCTSYIPAHAVAFEVLTTGLTNVFFRIDHTKRLEQPDAPVDLLYYVVSGMQDNGPSERVDSSFMWKPDSLCLTFLYALLRSLSAAMTTTEAERVQWSESLAAALPTVKQLGFFGAIESAKQGKASTGEAKTAQDGDQDDADDHGDKKDRDDIAGGNGRGSHSSTGPDHGSQGQRGGRGGRGRSVRGKGSGNGGRRGRGSSQQQRHNGHFDGIADQKGWESRKPTPFDTPSPNLCTALLETAATQAESDGESDQGDSSTSSIPSLTESVSTASSASIKSSPSPSDSCRHSSSIGASVVPFRPISSPYFSHSTEHEWDGSERYRGRSATLITQQWCSSACLLGLKNGSAMDPACPNAKYHCKLGDKCQDHSKHGHLLSIEQLRADLKAELRYGAIVHVMEPIAHGTSSRCQLFRISHPKFGYALAAKGTHALNEWSLLHEDWMYEHLRKRLAENGLPERAEGSASARNGYPIINMTKPSKTGQEGVALQLPISFGVIKPAPEYCDVMYPLWPSKDHFEVANICNTFLLLSYHGHSLRHPDERSLVRQRLPAGLQDIGDLEVWVKRALSKAGVWHDDIAPRNLLWCRQLEALIMIDFEEARLRRS